VAGEAVSALELERFVERVEDWAEVDAGEAF
jgi:hypothetical protein